MIAGTIYTEPKTHCEILIMDHGKDTIGAVYDPRRMGDALPWHLQCEHCRKSRQAKLLPDLRRALNLFISKQPSVPAGNARGVDVYKVPSRTTTYLVRHWTEDNDHYADVECPKGTRLHFSLPEDRPLKIKGEGERRALILLRAIRLIFSGRPAQPTEIAALASYFEHSPEIHKKGCRNLCYKINWSEIRSALIPSQSSDNPT